VFFCVPRGCCLMIEVLHPGLLTTIQDSGRSGYEQYGFPHSGFFDPFLAGIANRLVGNSPDAPLLEFALIGPTLQFRAPASVAITGHEVVYECGDVLPFNRAVQIREAGVLRFLSMKGWFGYIAISGAIVANKLLGSASTYSAGNLGTRLQKNSTLSFGEGKKEAWALREGVLKKTEDPVLHLLPAQHTSGFAAMEIDRIAAHEFQIHAQSNRMGIRLDGVSIQSPNIRRSVPTLPGAVQVPGSGQPIILGPEGPTTGGYSQIGMISCASWTVLASRRPGTLVRFQWIDLKNARQISRHRQKILAGADAWEKL
jgi:antagonist of KipI